MDIIWIILISCLFIAIFIILWCCFKNTKETEKRKSTREIGITEITDFCKNEIGKPVYNFDIEKGKQRTLKKKWDSDHKLIQLPKHFRNSVDINLNNIKHSSRKTMPLNIQKKPKSNNNTFNSESIFSVKLEDNSLQSLQTNLKIIEFLKNVQRKNSLKHDNSRQMQTIN